MKLTQIVLAVTCTIFFTASTAFADNATTASPCSAKPFLVTSVGRTHYAVSAGCNETSSTCGQKSRELMDDCEYRNEDGGSVYTSCECQGVREYKTCMQDGGCNWHSEYVRIQNDYWYCFIQ